MFDTETAELIRAAPSLRGVNADTLPQELTRIYAELTALRLRADLLLEDEQQRRAMTRLRSLAAIYEAVVDAGGEGEARRASAFVSGTAYQILGRVAERPSDSPQPLLGISAIHPDLAAPLLFLIAEQNSDAREAAAKLQHIAQEDLLRDALVETVRDLATEQFASILSRSERLRQTGPLTTAPLETRAVQALYGLCWTGIVALVANLLGKDAPPSRFLRFDTPQAAFSRVVELSTRRIDLPGVGGQLVSTYAGPRHLARLLRHVADGLQDAGVANVPPPHGVDSAFWSKWLNHRAASKPVLWRNHREAIATGFLDAGRSSVLVLPTGAGKTTLSSSRLLQPSRPIAR